MLSRTTLIGAAALVLGLASVGSASPIVFTPGPNTENRTALNNISYNPTTGLLTMSGTAQTWRLPGNMGITSGPGIFTLAARADHAGNATGPGHTDTLVVTGGIPTQSPAVGSFSTVLAGNITAFDFIPYKAAANVPVIFQFLVSVTNDPQSLGFGVGALAGIIVPTNDVLGADFSSSFFSGSPSNADVAATSATVTSN